MTGQSFGNFEMSPAGPFEAGSFTTVTFTYTVGDAGLKNGGRLRIGTPNQGWGEPHVLCPNPIGETVEGPARTHNPWKPINTTFQVESRSRAWLRMSSEERMVVAALVPDRDGWDWAPSALFWRWWIIADVELDDFQPGDVIRITYGDTADDPYGVRVQPFPDDRVRPFTCLIDCRGDGELREVSGSPIVPTIVAGPPEKVIAAAPSFVRPGETFSVRAAVLDRNLTPPRHPYEGPIEFRSADDFFRICQEETGREGSAWTVPAVAGPGTGTIRISTSVGEAATNPVVVSPEEQRLYWGDLHAQCMYHQWKVSEERGDSTCTAAELYQYAREGSLLDFVALTNSGCPSPLNPGWEETQQATIDAYEPHRFVSFKGWECGMGVQGDRCLIYREADVEPNFEMPRRDDASPSNAHALLRFCREAPYHILTCSHHLMKYMDWSVLDPEVDRLMEIYSCWGSYESREDNPLNSKRRPNRQSARYALGLGYNLGIVAAGDSHVGYPGRSLMEGDPYLCQNWKAGLAGVYAPELTREALWDALYHRHCYATTGVRIVLQFRLNRARMGSILEYGKQDEKLCRREIEISVQGTDLIRRIDLIKNNGLLESRCPGSDSADLYLVDEVEAPARTRDWYYVRVLQADGNAAWSSPIWVSPEGIAQPSESLGE